MIYIVDIDGTICKEVFLPNGKKEKGIFSSIDNEGGLILSTKKSDKVFYAAEIFEGL